MRRIAQVGLILTTMMVLLSSCNPYNKMQKNFDDIQVTANPEVLTLKGTDVTTDVTVTFPKKYFYEEMLLKITPVLTFEGGEIAGTPKIIQGEDVRENYDSIPWKYGGSYTQTVTFPYDSRAAFSKLELRVEGKTSDKCRKVKLQDWTTFGSIPVAYGVRNLQALANIPYMSEMPHNFTRVQTFTEEAEIHYLVNSSSVRNNQLSQDQIKLFKDFVKENTSDAEAVVEPIKAKGYASPEGPVNFNEKLSGDRSKSGEKAIQNTLKGLDVDYTHESYGEDWDGFKKLVEESNMPDKDLILQVLAMYSDSNKRDREIRNLSSVYNELKKNILPQLRRTQLVATVKKEGKSDAEILSGLKKNDRTLRLDEMLYGATLQTDAKAKEAALRLAANQYNAASAYNNLAVLLVKEGDAKGAKEAIDKAAKLESNPIITNNLGAVAFAQGDFDAAKSYFSQLNTAEANKNKALVDLWEGNYAKAANQLDGYNRAVAEVLNGNYANAKAVLGNGQCADCEYLRGVIAMREGDSKGAISYLKSAIAKEPKLKAKAMKDVEFARLFDTPEFKNL